MVAHSHSGLTQPLQMILMAKVRHVGEERWYYAKWRMWGTQRPRHCDGKRVHCECPWLRTKRCLPKQRVGSDHFFLSSNWYLKLLHGPLMNEKCKKREKPFFPWRNPICPRNVLSFVKLCLHEVFSKGLFQPTGSAVGNPGFCFQPCWQTEDGPHACPLTFLLWSWEGSTCCCHLD